MRQYSNKSVLVPPLDDELKTFGAREGRVLCRKLARVISAAVIRRPA